MVREASDAPGGLRLQPPGRRRVLTAVEFDVLWEWLGLGAMPAVLRLDSPGHGYAERRRVMANGWQGLRARGLADFAGPEPGLVRLMHLLATPTQQVEVRMRLGHELRGVAAGRPGSIALAIRQVTTITLSSATDPVDAVVWALPSAPPGAGRAITLPSEALEAVTAQAGAGRRLAKALIERGVAEEDARQIDAMFRNISRRGQLSVLAADRWGVLHRLRRVIGVVDTRHGRYIMQRRTAPDGVDWTTVCPVDPNGLRKRLEALLAEAQARAKRI